MRPYNLLFCVAALAACSHPQNPERKDPLNDQVTGQLQPTDPVFLKGDPAARVSCRGDADCPTGAMCYPSKNVCFTPKVPVSKLDVTCPLVPVYFARGSSELVRDAEPWIDYNASCLRTRGASKVTLDGFADATGGDEANLELSRQRAETVKKALEDQNAPVDIAVRAGGASQFIGGHNEHDYAYDRRVELTANR